MLRCYCLLESCGFPQACPSPPGSAPGACPSPPGKLLVPALLLLVRGCSTLPPSSASRDSIPWFGVSNGVMMRWELGVLLVVLVWPNGCVPHSAVHYFLLPVQLRSCGGDSTIFSQCDCAACKLLASVLHSGSIWSNPWMCCDGGLDTETLCTPVLNRTDTILDPNTQWCKWQYKLPKSESNLILTLTLFCFICCLFCRLLIQDQNGDLEDEIDSLELGFFSFSLL
jgi:hypothetical protein